MEAHLLTTILFARLYRSQPGIGARSLLRLFARRAAHGDLERMAVDGEEQDCVIA